MIFLSLVFSFFSNLHARSLPGNKPESVVLKAMKEEVNRSMTEYKKRVNPAPYFIAYRITENRSLKYTASDGVLRTKGKSCTRKLDVSLRVGSPQMDNTHPLRAFAFDDFAQNINISVENDADSIKNILWKVTDQKYKSAVERLTKIKTSQKVKVKEEDTSADFSAAPVEVYHESPAELPESLDTEGWQKRVKAYSAMFSSHGDIYQADVTLHGLAENKYFVNSEGTSLLHGTTHWRLSITARTVAEDGMNLYRARYFDARTPVNLPDDSIVKDAIHEIITELIALRNAPLMEPYTGPAILSPQASSVFFHEIFGHRVEGHREKDEEQAQTFGKKVGKEILPTFISVYDDPTMKKYGTIDLNGYYKFDDEGVKAQRVTVVDKGILKNFLMSRSPIERFPRSNGHGRAEAGLEPVSRQGVLIIESSQMISMDKLRGRLIEECKAQGKTYGLFFKDVAGGRTTTARAGTQSFSVIPITVFKVYVDGRPDELVRGATLIGTPLTSFSKIIACGNTPGIFNGYCGAESGRVPVSTIAPPILTAQIEVQKTPKSPHRPPVLPAPLQKGGNNEK